MVGQPCSKHQEKSVFYKTDGITCTAPSGFPGLTPGSNIIFTYSILQQHSNSKSVHMNSRNIRFSSLTGWICSSQMDPEQFSLWKSDWKQIWSWYPEHTDHCQIPQWCRCRASEQRDGCRNCKWTQDLPFSSTVMCSAIYISVYR